MVAWWSALALTLASLTLADDSSGLNQCPSPPPKELVCYYEGRTSVTNINACLCTSVVFTRTATANKDAGSFKVDIVLEKNRGCQAARSPGVLELLDKLSNMGAGRQPVPEYPECDPTQSGVRSDIRTLRKINPSLQAILLLPIRASDLKTESRRLRASEAVSAALRKATADGVEIQIDWSHQDAGAANKTQLTAFIKAVRFQLDSADAADRRRFKRDYEIFESSRKSTTPSSADVDTEETVTDHPTEGDFSESENAKETVSTDEYQEATVTTEAATPTGTTARSVPRTTRAEGSTAADAQELAAQYEALEGDHLDLEPSRLLVMQLPSKSEILAKYYDIRALTKYVDWFVLGSSNLTDASENGFTFHHSRLMGLDDNLNTDTLVDLVTGMGAPKSQVVISVPAFAQRFELKDSTRTTPRSPTMGNPVDMSQAELCEMMAEGGWFVERDQDLTAPYAFKNSSWVAFEDHMSIKIKGKYVLLRDLAGIAVRSVDDEDWLEKSCKKPQITDEDDKSDETDYNEEDNGDYKGEYEYEGDESGKSTEKIPEKKETENKSSNKTEGQKEKQPVEFMPVTLTETLFRTMTESARHSRAAVLSSLQDDIHQHAVEYEDYTGDVQLSPYQIVRVVDREGATHVVRRNAKTEFECSRQGYFVHPLSCNRFYRCVKFDQTSSDYTVYEFDCPEGLAFDERVEVCVWPGSLPGGACKGSSEIAPVPRSAYGCPNNEGYYADPENCRWFFACLDHARDGVTPLTAYEFRCPFGLVFDEVNQVCNWPWMVNGCGNSGRGGVLHFGTAGVSYQSSGAGLGVYAGGRTDAGLVSGTSLLSAGLGGVSSSSSGASGAGAGIYSASGGYNYRNGGGYASEDASNGAYYNNAAASGSGAYSAGGYSSSGNNAVNAEDVVGTGFSAGAAAYDQSSAVESESGYANNKLGASIYKQTSGISGSNLASEINANLGSTAYSGFASTGNSASGSYSGSNGYIASGEAQQDVSSRYEDRGYGGYATFPDSQISGGRIENTGGVVLGNNVHSTSTLTGIQSASGRYQYNNENSDSAAYNSGASNSQSTLVGSAGVGVHDFGAQHVEVQSDGGSGFSGVQPGIYTVTQAPAVHSTIVQSTTPASVSVTPAFEVKQYVSPTPAPVVVSYQQQKTYQSVTPGVATVSYQPGQIQSVTQVAPAASQEPVTQIPTLLTYQSFKVKQPLVHFQSVTPASTATFQSQEQNQNREQVSFQAHSLQQPVAQVAHKYEQPFINYQAVTTAPAYVAYQTKQTYEGNNIQSVTPVSHVKQSEIQYQSVTPAPAVVSYKTDSVQQNQNTGSNVYQFEQRQPVVQVQSVTPASVLVSQNVQEQVSHVNVVDEVQQPLVEVQSATPTPAPEFIDYTPTPAPSLFSFQAAKIQPVTPVIHAVQPVTPASSIFDFRAQSHVTSAPISHQVSIQTPQVSFNANQHEQSKISSLDEHSVKYSYSTPAPFSHSNVKFHKIVDIKMEPGANYEVHGYNQQNYQQPFSQVSYQSTVEQQAPAISHTQVDQIHSVNNVELQNFKTVQPAVQYQQQYQQVQPIAQVQYQDVKIKQERPVTQYTQSQYQQPAIVPLAPVTKIEYEAPAVQYQQNYQTVSHTKQVNQPETKIEYQAPAVQYQQNYQTVTQSYSAQPVAKVEYQAPVVQPVAKVEYQETVQPVQPVSNVHYQQNYQTVQKEIVQPIAKVEYQAPIVQTVTEAPKSHSFEFRQQYQEVKQPYAKVEYQETVQPVQPVANVHYQQNYQTYQKEVKPIAKVEYQAPIVQTVTEAPKSHSFEFRQQYQEVKQPYAKVEYQQTVQPVQPVANVHYQQNYQTVQKEIVQPIDKVEYQAPIVQAVTEAPKSHSFEFRQQYQEVKQPYAKVEYQQTVQPVQPVANVHYQQNYQTYQKEVKKPIAKVEYQAPVVQSVQQVTTAPHSFEFRQQYQEVKQPYGKVEYQETVQPVQPVANVEYQQSYQSIQKQSVQPAAPTPVSYVTQSVVSPTPIVTSYQKPLVKAQEVVYSFSTPSPVPIRQEGVRNIEVPVKTYQHHQYQKVETPAYQQINTAAPISRVTYKPQLYPFVTSTVSPAVSVSTTPATVSSYSSQYESGQKSTISQNLGQYTGSSISSGGTTITKVPLVQSYSYTEDTVPTTPASVSYETTTGCVSCSKSTTGLHVTSPAPPVQQTYNVNIPKFETDLQQGSVYVNEQRQQGVLHQAQQTAGDYNGVYELNQQTSYEEPPVALFVQTPKPAQQQIYVSSTPAIETRYTAQSPAVAQYNIGQEVISSTVAPEVSYEIPAGQVVQRPHSQVTYESYSKPTTAPIVVAEFTSTVQPADVVQPVIYPTTSKPQVIETYSTPKPVYNREYYTTPRPIVSKTIVRQEVEQPILVSQEPSYNAADVNQQYGYKTQSNKVVSEYNYVQNPAAEVYPTSIDFAAVTTPSPDTEVVYTTAKPELPPRRLRPTTTAQSYVEEEVNQVSGGYAGSTVEQNVPIAVTPGYVEVSQQTSRGGQKFKYDENEDVEGILEQNAGNFGGKNDAFVEGVIRQDLNAAVAQSVGTTGQISQVHRQSGHRGFSSSRYESAYGGGSTEGYEQVSTVRTKPRKRTKIVVVTRLSDVNPLLIGKLGAQCSCRSNDLQVGRRRRPGLKRVVSRVRVVRPKDIAVSSEGYVSSTTERYESSSAKSREEEKAAELEEDIALIRDSEKDNDDDNDDDDNNNDNDFGAVVSSSTEGSSTAAYEVEDDDSSSSSLASSTVASRSRSRSRGRTSYLRAGRVKSTIYVSTTSEPDADADVSPASSTTAYEVTSARQRKASSSAQDDANAVVIAARPRSHSKASRSRGDNEVTPGPGHTVDLGANGVVDCKRPGLFRHPELCNKFYSCNWDSWKKKYVVNVFNCPIHLAYDTTIGACNWPSKGPACVNGKLLV